MGIFRCDRVPEGLYVAARACEKTADALCFVSPARRAPPWTYTKRVGNPLFK